MADKRYHYEIPDEMLVLAVLLGQADGKVFIPRSAVVTVERMRMAIEQSQDPLRDGWYVWLEPGTMSAQIDGTLRHD